MRYLTFDGAEKENYRYCFLVPRLSEEEIRKHYIEPYGLDPAEVIAFNLVQKGKKTPVKDQKEYLTDLVPVLKELGIKYTVVCDAEYYKTLAKQKKADAMLGYMVEPESDVAKQNGFNALISYCPNFAQIFYDPPKITAKIDQAMHSLMQHIRGAYNDPGTDIIKTGVFPEMMEGIRQWLVKLLDMNCDLSCDIEGFSLKHYDAGIGTITFCWNQHEGVAFPVDWTRQGHKSSMQLRQWLREFFIEFAARGRKMVWHNAAFDVTVLIYQLFMKDILDTEGLLMGLDVFLTHMNWDDTKIITYLATNSCAGNKLGLKDQSQEFAGNYAQEDIKDITKIPFDELLKYNLVDGIATWYVYNKHWDTLVADQQLDIYNNLFKPGLVDIVQMQLTGMPMDMNQVKKAKREMQKDERNAMQRVLGLEITRRFNRVLEEAHIEKRNSELKTKRIAFGDEPQTFNLNSDPQIRKFVYECLDMPVIDKTKTKLPATGADALAKLVHHATDPEVRELLKALQDYKAVNKILTSFIPAFESAVKGPDGWYYLFGNFNLGGTISGRLSSSDPNLQNIPSSSKYSKLIKLCFKAPPGWMFCGLDFDSLEDKISALTTKDPNKIKVYTDGYDGHCLRAHFYFREQMPDIIDTVESINSIAKKYKPLRQDSKAPTFALTYQGTYITLMNNCGFSEQKAKMIEGRYHEMYVVSDRWVQTKLDQAGKDGYITAAFGLRVRTPLLNQVVRGTRRTPFEAEAEGRTAGNALGQSWCLLNTRASIEFMGKVRKSKYRLDIRPCAHIHDAQYHLVREDIGVFLYYNEHISKAALWQDHPDIWHDEVKLGGKASIFYPNWAYEKSFDNDETEETVREKIADHMEYLKEEGVI